MTLARSAFAALCPVRYNATMGAVLPRAASLLLAVWLGLAAATGARAADLTVFAAASLKTALDEIAADWATETGGTLSIVLAGSSALARQIEQGAPADLFISASPEWMDELDTQGLLEPGSRRDLLGNTLVLVAHGPDAAPLDLVPGAPLAGRLGDGRLAMALVDAVPAGIYGKAALMNLGLWDSVSAKVAQTDNVRAALALVATGEAPLGIVYASDALAEPGVSVAGIFPADSHPPIVYPAAAIAGPRATEALAFLDWLDGPAAQAAFLRQGFEVLR